MLKPASKANVTFSRVTNILIYVCHLNHGQALVDNNAIHIPMMFLFSASKSASNHVCNGVIVHVVFLCNGVIVQLKEAYDKCRAKKAKVG